ncbi:MAG TPA: PQQ-binding-like beta-propeller repeat protein [Anaerolineales bacterium]|nr:PQQ-binding-like beta-propeller repeat protein [Anaerolineales bacterium]
MARPQRSPSRWLWPVLALAAFLLASCSSTGVPWPGISADSERAYVAFGQAVFAIHLSNGQEAWRFPVEKPARDQLFYAAPALTDSGLVIAGGYDHKVYALSKDNGDLTWTFTGAQERIIGAPVASGDVVYVPVADGTLFALGVSDGVEQWSFHADGALWSAPLVVDDHIYIGTLTHKVYALSLGGDILWTRDVGGAIAESPSIVDDTLLVGALGQPLRALDPKTGDERWTAASAQWIWAGAVSGDGTAYFGDLGGRLAAVSIADGAVLDEVQLDGAITGRPAVDATHLYVATEVGTVRSLSLEGFASEWTQPVPTGKLYGPLHLQGDTLIVGVVGRNLDVAAFDASSGTLRWTYPAANR